MKKHTKILIKGTPWKVFFLEEDAFIKKFGEVIGAITVIDYKEVYFHDGEIYKAHITHELCHAYYSSMCLGSTTLTNHQLEEVWCDMFALHGDSIMRQTRLIWKQLKVLEEEA